MSKIQGLLLNVTGDELGHDMACPSTVECTTLEPGLDIWFYDENKAPLVNRVQRICDAVEKHADRIGAIIIENNEIGRAVHDKLSSKFRFVSSVKRPNSTLHWYYTNIDRIQDPVAVEERTKIIQETKDGSMVRSSADRRSSQVSN